MPHDKLFSRLEMPKAVFQNENITVMEAQLPDHPIPFCIIEYSVSNETLLLSLSKLLPQYKNLSHPNILKIHYWTYDMKWLKNADKLFKIFFIIDHFDSDIRELLGQRAKKERFLFERDIYRLTKELAEALMEAQKANVPLSPIVSENFVSSNNKLKYIPYIFLSEIFSKRRLKIYPKFNPSTVTSISSLLPPIKVKQTRSDYGKESIFISKTPKAGSSNALMTSSAPISFSPERKKFGNLLGSLTSRNVLPNTSFQNSSNILGKSPLITKTNDINSFINNNTSFAVSSMASTFEKELLSTKVLYEDGIKEQENKKRIYNLAIVLLMIAENHVVENDEEDFVNPQRLTAIAARYGREYSDLIRAMTHSDQRKRPNFEHVIYIIAMIVKSKGSDDIFSFDASKQSSGGTQKGNILLSLSDENLRFMAFFPELYQKLVIVNITNDKSKIFSEMEELNLDFIVPVEHR